MNDWPSEQRLYELLPAYYRQRDHEQGEPLRALLAIIQQEVERLEGDIESLYENWFVETAQEWVLPYIGDLLGVTNLHTVPGASVYSLRAYFANTLSYRQRKGTAAVLEQLANDVTGWEARVVEFFQLLGTTQHLNHLRLHNVRTPDLRDSNELELLGSSGQVVRNPNDGHLMFDLYRSKLRDSPFHSVAHTGEVRRIAERQGHFNIPNIGIYLWRLVAYPMGENTPATARQLGANRFTFNQLGLDAPLFNRPAVEPEIAHIATEIYTPTPVRRRALHDELERLRAAIARGATAPLAHFGDNPVLQVLLPDPLALDTLVAVPAREIAICDLNAWTPPADAKSYPTGNLIAGGAPDDPPEVEMIELPITLAIDPVLGRLVFTDDNVPEEPPAVSYNYGFSADVGGGPYQRRDSVSAALAREVTWQIGVSQTEAAVPGEIVSSLTEAINEWNIQPPGTVGIIAIMDSHSYEENLIGAAAVLMPATSQLLIVGADWPAEPVPGLPGVTQRVIGHVNPNRRRPHILGGISIRGTALESDESQGALTLDGLLVEGNVRVLIGNLARLALHHCTIVPGSGSLTVNQSVAPNTENDRLEVTLLRSIVGGVDLADSVPKFVGVESIIHGRPDPEAVTDPPPLLALIASGAHVSLEGSTLLGQATSRTLYASNTIFTEVVTVERRQVGCVRFSVLPLDSRTPRRFRCQPDLALDGIDDEDQQSAIILRLRPQFTASTYGHPAYGQLSQGCAVEIRQGAEDGSEMGVFTLLKQPQREANLRVALDEYTPFGLHTGIFYVT